MGEINFFEAVEKGDLCDEYSTYKELWKASANTITQQPYYYVKNAYIRFELNGNHYFVGANTLGISNELFEYIEKEIEADLKSIGANQIHYCGVID